MLAVVVGLLCALVAGACGTEGPAAGPDAGDPSTISLRGACDLGERYGGFTVASNADYSLVDGKVADGVVPVNVLEETKVEGVCRLLRRRNPFCDPPCQAGQTCNFDGSCIRFPEQQDLGHVSIGGLEKAIELDPLQPGNSYFDTDVPHPVFEAGRLVSLRTTAGAYGELALHGVGVEALTLGESMWTMSEGARLEVTWNAPTSPTRARVELRVSIDQHGNSPLALVCEFEDTGMGQVPATLVDELINSGVSGYPSGSLSRRTVDSVDVGGGCMDLAVSSPREQTVRVAGHTPCTRPDQCPSGQTCDTENQTCR
jgi:hypothetical protein